MEWELLAGRLVHEFAVGGLITDLGISDGPLYFSTLEGKVGRLRNGRVEKSRLTDNTLWTLATIGDLIFATG